MALFNLKCIWGGSSRMPSISDPMDLPGTEKGERLEGSQTWSSSFVLATAKRLLLFSI